MSAARGSVQRSALEEPLAGLRTFARENGLALFFGGLFLLALVGQSFAGLHSYNSEQLLHGGETVSYSRYISSSHFGEAVIENWQSEFLQFALFILATVWLLQRGSPESKQPDKQGLESKKEQRIGYAASSDSPRWARLGGWRTAIYSNSLLLAMAVVFFAAWAVQSLTSWSEFNDEQREHGAPAVSWGGYVLQADFWEKTLQNWQSEFLAVGVFAVFTIYLRQRGSPESKPVGAPHSETGSSG